MKIIITWHLSILDWYWIHSRIEDWFFFIPGWKNLKIFHFPSGFHPFIWFGGLVSALSQTWHGM